MIGGIWVIRGGDWGLVVYGWGGVCVIGGVWVIRGGDLGYQGG